MTKKDLSGLLAANFVRSKLTPLLILLSLSMGALATLLNAKEEEPSITVTVADVLVSFPGRGPDEVDERLAQPLTAVIREIASVKRVVSSASSDGVLITVQFEDGVPKSEALSHLYERLLANQAMLPAGTPPPLIKPRGVEDVPALALCYWSQEGDSALLRRLTAELAAELRSLPDVSRVELIGGARRTIQVELDSQRLSKQNLPVLQIEQALQAANLRLPAGYISGPEGLYQLEVGSLLHSAQDVGALIVGLNGAGPVYLRDVAQITDGFETPNNYVGHFAAEQAWSERTALTLVLTKVAGSNASDVTQLALRRVARFNRENLPKSIQMEIVRDAGKTAVHRVTTLIEHMAIATMVVILLIGLALGRREALIVSIVIPVTLAVVPFVYWLVGFTLNRITLAAMIFAIGILVDDAIVVIENIHRHFAHRRDASWLEVTVAAVQEVGNPTILATFAVIFALMPTAFVTGMTGQYVRALPIGSSIAMLYSLVVALTVTPYLAYRLLHRNSSHESEEPSASKSRRLLSWLLEKRSRLWAVHGAAVLLLLASFALVPTRIAVLKLLPQGDVDEMSVVVDLPANFTLQQSHRRVAQLARSLGEIEQIKSVQAYVGTNSPLTFQGVARLYAFRQAPYQAELHVQLYNKSDRDLSSHEIAALVRTKAQKHVGALNAHFTVAELPPGPPVQASLVAEIYGPDQAGRLALAEKVKAAFEHSPGTTDVDWTGRRGPPVLSYELDHQQSALRGVPVAQAASALRGLFVGSQQVWAQLPDEREPVPITTRVPAHQRASPQDVKALNLISVQGQAVPAMDIGTFKNQPGPRPRLRKDMQALQMVTAETIGDGPVYSAIELTQELSKNPSFRGLPLNFLWTDSLPDPDSYSIRWAGEWTSTYEMFRDLGGAFIVVLFLLYALLVAWYQSFLTPAVVMLPIPLTFVGVIPGHAILDMPMSGMAVIGVIALAGLMVRNSILLVDFAQTNLAAGMSVREAVLSATTARVRPIVLTAATVILGDGILFFDPLLKGLGLTMASGALVSTALTLFLVPIAYFQLMSWLSEREQPESY